MAAGRVALSTSSLFRQGYFLEGLGSLVKQRFLIAEGEWPCRFLKSKNYYTGLYLVYRHIEKGNENSKHISVLIQTQVKFC
jgi:hypothetical protein